MKIMKTAILLGLSVIHVGLVVASGNGETTGKAMFEDKVIVPLPDNHTHRGCTGTILPLKDGSFLFVYTAVEDTALRYVGGAGIAARRSTDLGRTWGDRFIVQPRAGLGETGHPSLLRLDNGKILLAYDVQNLTTDSPNAGGDQHMYVRLSSDEGKSWTEQLCATFMPGICHAMPDKAIQISTGRIIIPVESSWPVTGHGHFVSLCFYSDDGGYLWLPSRNVVDLGSNTTEPSVVELADGRLIMMCRNQLGYLARSYSKDKGLNWSKPELITDLKASPTGFHAVRLPTTGDLLVIYCNNPHRARLRAEGKKEETFVRVAQWTNYPLSAVRAPMASAISRDGGKTWSEHRDITHDPEGVYGDYGYPGITFIEDGKVALVNYHAIDGIHLARIGVDWFYGK